MTGAGKLLVGQAAGLAVAGIGGGIALLLRGQRESARRAERQDDTLHDRITDLFLRLKNVEDFERENVSLMTELVNYKKEQRDELEARRTRR